MENQENVIVNVYELRDPRDLECKPRYVGITICSLNKRLREHIHSIKKYPDTYKSRWIQKLLNQNVKPTIHLIEQVMGLKHANQVEIYWIKEFKEQGYILTNATSGGDSFAGFTMSEETKRKISQKYMGAGNPMYNKKVSDETKQKMSEAQKGRKHSQETLKKLSDCKTGENNPMYGCTGYWLGKKFSETAKLNMSLNNAQPIVELDMDGNFLREYRTVREAVEILQLSGGSLLYNVLKGDTKFIKKYPEKRWKWKKDYEANMDI